MRFFLASLLILQHNFAWAGPRSIVASSRPEVQALKQAAADLPQKKKVTLREFIQKLEEQTPKSYLQNFKQQITPHLNETLEFEVLGPARFVLRSEGNETLFEILSLKDGEFKINNRRAVIDFSKSPEDILAQMNGLLSNKTAAHPLQLLFFPRAEAFEWLLIGAAAVGVGLIAYNYYNCTQYDKMAQQCTLVLSNPGSSPQQVLALYNDVKELNQKWFTFFCQKKDFVKTCEASLAAKLTTGTTILNDGPRLITPAVK